MDNNNNKNEQDTCYFQTVKKKRKEYHVLKDRLPVEKKF